MLGRRLSVAMVLADAANGEVLAYVGSGGLFDRGPAGEIDMASAVRSPGSALKPLIYGLAFEQGLIAQETLIEDRPADFSGYRPGNFDMTYQGEVSVRRRCSCRSTCRRSGCSMRSGRSCWHRG